MILTKDPPIQHLRLLQSKRHSSPHKINTLTEGLQRLLKRAVELHNYESDSARLRKQTPIRSSQTLTAKSNSKLIESTSRIIVNSPTKHPPKMTKDSPVKPSVRQQKKVRIDHFVLGKKLGTGKFSDVYLCMHKQTRTIYAVKTMLKSVIGEYRMEAQLHQQFEIQNKLDHPNIIKSYAKFEDEFHYFILMEYFHGEELLKRLKSNEKTVAAIVRQVIEAVMFLHRNGYAHRDLKPENILINREGHIKITDFGCVGDCVNQMRNTFCGTYDYLSPEVLAKKMHNVQVDIWAIGILTYELLSGEVPFKNIKNTQSIQLERIVFPNTFSERASRFISLFLVHNPKERVNLTIALGHQFLTQHP